MKLTGSHRISGHIDTHTPKKYGLNISIETKNSAYRKNMVDYSSK